MLLSFLLSSLLSLSHIGFEPLPSSLLPSDEVSHLCQDEEGYVWIVTTAGLARYDAYTTRIYPSEGENGEFAGRTPRRVLAVPEGMLIGTDKGFLLLDTSTGKVSAVSDPAVDNLNVNALLRDANGRIYACGDKGVFFSDHSASFQKLDLRGREGEIGDLIDLLPDSNGNLWISSWHNGLYRYDLTDGRLFCYRGGDLKDAYVLHLDRSGRLWVGTWGSGLLCIEGDELYSESPHYRLWKSSPKADSLPDDIIYDIDEDSQGNLLVGSRSGYSIMHPDGKGFDNFFPGSDKGDLPFNEVNSILHCTDGSTFLGLFGGGVCRVVQSPRGGMSTMDLESIRAKLKTNSVKSLSKSPDGKWLLGIGGQGIVFYEQATDRFTSFLDSPAFRGIPYMSEIEDICTVSNTILLASYERGLFSLSEGRVKVFNTANSPLRSNCIHSLAPYGEAGVLVGSAQGMYLLESDGELRETSAGNLRVEDIAVGADSAIYLACGSDGLYCLSEGKLRHIKSGEGSFSCISADPLGRIWTGNSRDGIYLYNPSDDKAVRISELDFVDGKEIRNIHASSDSRIWITTDNRATSFSFEDGMVSDVRYHSLKAEGNSLYFNRNAAFEVKNDSTMAFGTSHGVVFFPIFEGSGGYGTARAVITSFDSSRKSLPEAGKSGKVSLASSDNDFTLSFSMMDFGDGEGCVYKYRLRRSGSHGDNGWSIIGGGDNTASFSEVKPGKYIFELLGAKDGATLDRSLTTLEIEVRPNPLLSWWAIVLYIIAGSALTVFSIHGARSRMELRQKARYEQLNAQKSEEVNQAKLRFFTDVSHEFLTPLSIILASIESLKPRSEEDKQILNVMSSNAIRLTRLVQQVLDFRKAESNNLNLQVSKGDVADFVGRCVEAFQPLVRKHGLIISYETSPKSIEAWFDPDKLDKIMYNLISNAVKYTPEGGEVKVRVGEENGKTLLIQVANGGPLMSEKTRAKLFRRFYEGDFRKYSTLGNGIGLSLVKSLVETHKGSISVESSPETGNLFCVRLPLKKDSYTGDEIDTETIPDTPLAFSMGESIIKDEHHTVLLVDDNADVLSSFGAILSKSFNVRSCTNAEQAMEILRSGGADIVVADVMMPGVNGYELCSKIKGSIETSHIPVILLTGRTDEQAGVEGWQSGADGFLTKPCNFSVLTAMIRNLLRKQESKSADFRKQLVFEVKDIDYTSMDKKFLQQAIDVVNSHIADSEFDQSAFVDAMNVSRTVLTEKLKSLTGFTPMAFIVNARLTLAYKLLMEENDKIRVSDLAYTVGFNDAKYFSKKFKAKFGKSPKEIIDEKNNK